MDPFTERMLERARARREMLYERLTNNGQPCGKRVSPECAVVAVADQDSDNTGSESDIVETDHRTTTPQKDVVFKEVEFEEGVEDLSAALTAGVRSRLQRLGALYSDSEQLSSPIHRTENNFSVEQNLHKTRNKSATRSARLAALANSINQWEDDLSHPNIANSTSKEQSPLSAKSEPSFSLIGVKRKSHDKIETIVDKNKTQNMGISSSRLPGLKANRKSGGGSNSTPEVTASPRQLQWDRAMLDSLEAQGFTRSESNSRLIYDYEEEKLNSSVESENVLCRVESPSKKNVGSPMKTKPTCESPLKNSVSKETAQSPLRSPLVMGVAQLRRTNASPLNPIAASPNKVTSVKSPSKTAINLAKAVGESPPKGSVLQRAAQYESEAVSPPKRHAKDPAELPLTERMALFEKNKGPLLVPKVPFSTPMPANLLKENEKVITRSKSPRKLHTSSSPVKESSPIKSQAGESAVLRRLRQFETGKVLVEDSPSRPQNQAVAERRKEMEMLTNRWNRNKEFASDDCSTPVKTADSAASGVPPSPPRPPPPPPPPPPLPSSPTRRSPRRSASHDCYPGVSEIKRIKVSPPKPGCLYPSLSDVEGTTESSANQSLEDEDCSLELGSADDSFGKDILEAAEKVSSSYCSTKETKFNMSDKETAVLQDMDDFLDEALEESSEEEQHSPTPFKKTRGKASKSSDSFARQRNEPERKSARRASTKYRAPQPPLQDTPSSSVDNQQVSLVRTISHYRRENVTPRSYMAQVSHEENSIGASVDQSKDCEEETRLVELRVRELCDDVSKQQTVISQASQALNLCNATVEFYGSSEQVEGERLLLLATHRRQAALNEVQRLKVEGSLRPAHPGGDALGLTDRGTLHIHSILLPVKRDFVRSLAAEDNSHHFVCLAKCQDVVVATAVASVANARELQGQAVRFVSSLTLSDLCTNFRVTLEVYTLACRKEMLPHDVKYHIKKETSKRTTPKKHKHDSHLSRPPVQSPAGPSAVRSPQFTLIGYVIFSLKEIQRTSFTLNKVPYTSPLEGSIQLQLDCDLSLDIEHRGFLTMFDVVSGFGAWHRRWCLLKGEMLSYWKYPDHEKKEIAIGSIDLKSCVTDHVGVVSRDICARLHTFLLETSRPARRDDEDSLVLICKGDRTLVRHMLSADTREERIEWCTQLNKALTVIRAWSKKPDQ